MAIYTAKIPLKLPSLNDYVLACRSNKFLAAKMKKDTEYEIGAYLQDIPHITKPVLINFHWIEGSKRRDIDNVAFAKKFILDALVKYGKLENDDNRYVAGFMDSFEYGRKFAVYVTIEEVEI